MSTTDLVATTNGSIATAFTHAYVGFLPCGCCVAAAVEDRQR